MSSFLPLKFKRDMEELGRATKIVAHELQIDYHTWTCFLGKEELEMIFYHHTVI